MWFLSSVLRTYTENHNPPPIPLLLLLLLLLQLLLPLLLLLLLLLLLVLLPLLLLLLHRIVTQSIQAQIDVKNRERILKTNTSLWIKQTLHIGKIESRRIVAQVTV